MFHVKPTDGAVTRGAQGVSSLWKIIRHPLEKCVAHSLKKLGLSQKTLRHPWCPKLVTGL